MFVSVVEVNEKTKLRDLLERIDLDYIYIVVNGKIIEDTDIEVNPDDEVLLIPIIAGGA